MPARLGLKLWSNNPSSWFAQAVALAHQGVIDAVELYTLPGQVDLTQVAALKSIPVVLHAAHEGHGFNVSTLTAAEIERFRREVSGTADFFGSPTIVVHAGIGHSDDQYAEQLAKLREPRIIVENMPYWGLHRERCYGFSLPQLTFIRRTMDRQLCLDFGHAVKSAGTQGLDYKQFITAIIAQLKPSYFHLSDGNMAKDTDEHLSLGDGNYDLPWLKKQLDAVAAQRDTTVIFEVPKNGVDLQNDVECIKRWAAL